MGLVWAGSHSHRNDANRSMRLADLVPLLELSHLQFVSLQREPTEADETILRAHPQILHIGASLGDFDTTAAAISLLDLVICVDTAVAHLAGALGKPLWLLLPRVADFRWMCERLDSPWYPTARLYRQSAPRGWNDVVSAVAGHLAERFAPID